MIIQLYGRLLCIKNKSWDRRIRMLKLTFYCSHAEHFSRNLFLGCKYTNLAIDVLTYNLDHLTEQGKTLS